MKQICVLVSGSGSNLQAIIDAIKDKKLKEANIALVISNKNNAYGLTRAKEASIKSIFINPKDFSSNLEYDKNLVEIINTHNIDLIVLAGYTKILTDLFVNSFPNKIINIHPALLPNFGGKGMYGKHVHEAVLKSGVPESGCTVHYVTNEIDAGPIISQKKVPVLKGDTVDTLSKRILEEEHKLIVEGIKLALNRVEA